MCTIAVGYRVMYIWKQLLGYAVCKYVNKGILSTKVKKVEELVLVCVIITTHAFCFPKATICYSLL